MRWCFLAVLVACGTPEHDAHHPKPVAEPRSTEPMNASADRDHPTRMSDAQHKSYDSAELDVRTPRAGSWWFAVTISPVRAGMVASGPANIQVLSGAVKLFVVEGAAMQANPQRLDLPTPSEGRYLLRADTQAAAEFSLVFSRSLQLAPALPSGPDCDPDHIDHSNPNCAGVFPRCNLNDPDFKNPNCCAAKCQFGRRQCATVVTKVSSSARGSTVEIGIGADQEIMQGARVAIGDSALSATGVVMGVADRSSHVILDKPNEADLKKLLGAPAVLDRPAQCERH
jgi:hypothetical protein